MMASTVDFKLTFSEPLQAAAFFQYLSQAFKAAAATIGQAVDPRTPDAIGLPTETPDLPKTSGGNAGTTAPVERTAPATDTAAETKTTAARKPRAKAAEPATPAEEKKPDALAELIGETPSAEPGTAVSVDQLRRLGSQVINAKGLGPRIVKEALDSVGAEKYGDVAEGDRAKVFAIFRDKLVAAGFDPEIPF